MPDLCDETIRALLDPTDPLWFPNVADKLAAFRWQLLEQESGLTAESYGTARAMARTVSAPRQITTALIVDGVRIARQRSGTNVFIESLPDYFSNRLSDATFEFYEDHEILRSQTLGPLHDAFSLFSRVPTLTSSIFAFTRTIHVVKPYDDAYDISFSDPAAPFSVFVSIPRKPCAHLTWRIAESILHEAMHQQLATIEKNVSLLMPSKREFYSPWRGELRSAHGILHAAYVFRVIERFLERASRLRIVESDTRYYIDSRRQEINGQLCEIMSFRDCSTLTPIGREFVCRLLAN